MDIYAALQLATHDREASAMHAAELGDDRTGVFLCFDRESVEIGLRMRWGIDSVEAARLMVQEHVASPVLGNFVRRRGGNGSVELLESELQRLQLPSLGDCFQWLADELVPDTKPPHPEAWLPDPCENLLRWWRTALTNDLIDGFRKSQRRQAMEHADELPPEIFDYAFGNEPTTLDPALHYDPGFEAVVAREIWAELGDDAILVDPAQPPGTLEMASSTYYYRRARAVERVRSICSKEVKSTSIPKKFDSDLE
jgi:hypothetical protein